jgi:RluA family pseudouridine synthase
MSQEKPEIEEKPEIKEVTEQVTTQNLSQEKVVKQHKPKVKPEQIETLRLSQKLNVTVVYEDRYLIAVDKPSGYLVAPAHWEQTSRNLMLMLRQGVEMGAPWARRRVLRFIANVHRLDADTSGVLLLAKNRPALSQMTDCFENRQVEKTYLALVKGEIKEDNFSVNAAIAEHPKVKGLMVIDKKFGRDSLTHFSVVERLGQYTLVKAFPITGRTHQIRIHLAWFGFPVVNDELYDPSLNQIQIREGSEQKHVKNKLPIQRLALHASQLSFKHPFLHQKICIEAPLPKDFVSTLKVLRSKK